MSGEKPRALSANSRRSTKAPSLRQNGDENVGPGLGYALLLSSSCLHHEIVLEQAATADIAIGSQVLKDAQETDLNPGVGQTLLFHATERPSRPVHGEFVNLRRNGLARSVL